MIIAAVKAKSLNMTSLNQLLHLLERYDSELVPDGVIEWLSPVAECLSMSPPDRPSRCCCLSISVVVGCPARRIQICDESPIYQTTTIANL
jgi:hypothetical protein